MNCLGQDQLVNIIGESCLLKWVLWLVLGLFGDSLRLGVVGVEAMDKRKS